MFSCCEYEFFSVFKEMGASLQRSIYNQLFVVVYEFVICLYFSHMLENTFVMVRYSEKSKIIIPFYLESTKSNIENITNFVSIIKVSV